MMKTQPYARLLAAACAGALASCAAPPKITKITKLPISASSRSDTSISGNLFQEVNSYRCGKGAGNLQRHAGLDRLAQEHCEYLRNHRGSFTLSGKNVSHIGFESRALVARERYQMENVSENVAAANHPGANMTSVLMGLWEGSKDHNKNMLDAWTHTGIGVLVDSDGTVFATELFATVSNSQMSLRDRFSHF